MVSKKCTYTTLLTTVLILQLHVDILHDEFVGESEPERHAMAEKAEVGGLEVVGQAVGGAPLHLEHAQERLLKMTVLVCQVVQLCHLYAW